mgnify:CR=1 FL=1
MFPQTGAENFLLKICDTSAVVVVLPFVPVIAMNGVLVLRYANSISEMIFIFFSFKRLKISDLGGMPGLVTAKDEPEINFSLCKPHSIFIPSDFNSSTCCRYSSLMSFTPFIPLS